MNKILVVAAHPDDEIIGIGGTIIKKVNEGYEAHALILGEGVSSRSDVDELKVSSEQQELYLQMEESARRVGYTTIQCLKLPDNRFDSLAILDIVHQIEEIIENIQPSIVYTHFEDDMNVDHSITHRAVLTATRPLNNCCVKEVYAFETLSSSEWYFTKSSFNPNVFIKIDNEIDQKLHALMAYSNEMREYPHPRSIEGVKIMNKSRGLTIQENFAEALMLIRKVER